MQNLQDDQRAELATYVQTRYGNYSPMPLTCHVSVLCLSCACHVPVMCRAGLNELYSASQRSLDTEQKLRQQLEQEVELQRSIRQEKEVRRGWSHIKVYAIILCAITNAS